MPHLIVTADRDSTGDAFVLAEELTPALFADLHRRDQLLERVGWALDVAAAAEDANPRLREASALAERLHLWFGQANFLKQRNDGIVMTRIIEAETTEPTGLECDDCQHREIDAHGRLGAIMARGAWAQSMSSSEDHLCSVCYRALEPIARENYWRRQPTRANGHPWPEHS